MGGGFAMVDGKSDVYFLDLRTRLAACNRSQAWKGRRAKEALAMVGGVAAVVIAVVVVVVQ